MNSRSMWEYYTNVIPRYAMFRLVYRLNRQPKKKYPPAAGASRFFVAKDGA